MPELNEAEKYLLENIRSGSAAAWTQLVERYQGRLVSFARSRLRSTSDPEDVVQETFVSFLTSLDRFRGESSVETYLFAILNRKIINAFRGRRSEVCLVQELLGGDDASTADAAVNLPSPDPTASWYARRNEEHAWQSQVLAAALRELVDAMKESLNFRDLQVIEMLFYCQLRNKDIAQIAGVRENHVALLKHRALAQVRDRIEQAPGSSCTAGIDPPDALLHQVWQDERLSCLKRGTIGAYLLGTLEPEWQDYVQFHLEKLGCRFCQANLEDLRCRTTEQSSQKLHDRILQSSIGFLSRPSG